MTSQVFTIDPAEQAGTALSRMKRRRIRHLVVMEDESVAGVISERDLGGPSAAPTDRTVRELMKPDVMSATPSTTLSDAAKLMVKHQIGSLPVLDRGRLVGIVTATDVLDELGRESRSRPESRRSRRRAPFPAQLPRALKPITGRTKPPLIPANVRVTGVEPGDETRAEIRRKLGARLGKFGSSIERVSVRVEDVNGPRGGVDKTCRIKVVLSGLPSVVFEHQEPVLDAAINGALAGIERAVRKTLGRTRTRPMKAVQTRTRAPGTDTQSD
jgi:predicted transcriptional regulator/ribosome-associated translation inhibitor RaiA